MTLDHLLFDIHKQARFLNLNCERCPDGRAWSSCRVAAASRLTCWCPQPPRRQRARTTRAPSCSNTASLRAVVSCNARQRTTTAQPQNHRRARMPRQSPCVAHVISCPCPTAHLHLLRLGIGRRAAVCGRRPLIGIRVINAAVGGCFRLVGRLDRSAQRVHEVHPGCHRRHRWPGGTCAGVSRTVINGNP